ncbi:MAG: phospholipase D-like domain-containing protein [Propionicimonas sp.]
MFGAVSLVAALATTPAMAIDWTVNPDTQEAVAPTNATADASSCPTLTAEPRGIEAWFNTDDMEYRGLGDTNNSPSQTWSFAHRAAQIICGAKQGATVYVGMFFIRAIGTAERPETDTEIIWNAMKWVTANRGVKFGFVMDGGSITSAAAKASIKKKLAEFNAALYWCYNGCLNLNTSSRFPDALNHEKFVAISDTIWAGDDQPHPAVYSSSGNFARSQVRNYWQEATLIYGDVKLYDFVVDRYEAMRVCSGSSTGSASCKSGNFPGGTQSGAAFTPKSYAKLRSIWTDKYFRHYTDADRGTTISFSPQPETVLDYYVEQFNDVDCTVDNKIRVAMYRLTDTRAVRFIDTVKSLKKQGCDVRVLLSQSGGASTISPKVAKQIKSAGLTAQINCTRIPIHTKMILIGPSTSNAGRIMFGTANMSTSGLRYSEEHVVTMDSRRATPEFATDIRHAYGAYQAGWNELNQGSKTCK